MAAGDMSTRGGRSLFTFIVSPLQLPDVQKILIAACDPLHLRQSGGRDRLDDPALPFELLPIPPSLLQNSFGEEEVERHHILPVDLGNPAHLTLLGSSNVEAQRVRCDDESSRGGHGDDSIEVLGTDQDVDVFREAWKTVDRQGDPAADAVLGSVPVQRVDQSQELLLRIHAAGSYLTPLAPAAGAGCW